VGAGVVGRSGRAGWGGGLEECGPTSQLGWKTLHFTNGFKEEIFLLPKEVSNFQFT